jgi:hypothetical protein
MEIEISGTKTKRRTRRRLSVPLRGSGFKLVKSCSVM